MRDKQLRQHLGKIKCMIFLNYLTTALLNYLNSYTRQKHKFTYNVNLFACSRLIKSNDAKKTEVANKMVNIVLSTMSIQQIQNKVKHG